MKKISVVMPVHNVNLHALELAVMSILHQSYTNFELLIFDDCSEEYVYKKLQDISKMDNRIILLRSEYNIKAGGARNKCIEYATGKYIALMDADDYCCEDRFEKQVAFLEENEQYAFVGCKAQYFQRNPLEEGDLYWFCEFPEKHDFLFTLPFVHASIMFRATALNKAKGYSLERRVYRCEDYELLMRLYAMGYKGANLRNILYFYRVDREAYKRRKYCYRFNETIVRINGFAKMGLLPRGIGYALKPLIVGLVPQNKLAALRKLYYKDK